jgi:NAD(P)-dependent dehydrogenase (short-subunit alcohol dehydrogenase family)
MATHAAPPEQHDVRHESRMSPDLRGRRALITGAASGIGWACALRLGAAGAQVLVLDLDLEGAETVARATGGVAVQADLSRPGFVDALPTDIDILVPRSSAPPPPASRSPAPSRPAAAVPRAAAATSATTRSRWASSPTSPASTPSWPARTL